MTSNTCTFMRIILILIISLLISLPASSQESSPISYRPFFWQKGYPLQWEHFQGKPDPSDLVHGAVTYAGIDVKVEKLEPWSGIITFKATAIFDQALSWVNPAKKDTRLLAHEQLHFDIAEVYARRLEKKLNSLRLTQGDKSKVKRLHQRYTQAQLAFQESYDKETLHGIKHREQQAWRRKIDQLLRQSETSSFHTRATPARKK